MATKFKSRYLSSISVFYFLQIKVQKESSKIDSIPSDQTAIHTRKQTVQKKNNGIVLKQNINIIFAPDINSISLTIIKHLTHSNITHTYTHIFVTPEAFTQWSKRDANELIYSDEMWTKHIDLFVCIRKIPKPKSISTVDLKGNPK